MRQHRKILWVVLFLALSLGLAGTTNAAGPELQVELEGKVRLASQDEENWSALEEGQAVAPGGQILYTVRLTNTGDAEAHSPRAIGPVPVGTVYLENAATAGDGVTVAYSIDGGKTFSAEPMMLVTASDGSTRSVPAPVERYTTIQWNWDSPLTAGEQQAVSYQVQVR
jgi:uncharacterized repeat protein (TIGR01451 family)